MRYEFFFFFFFLEGASGFEFFEEGLEEGLPPVGLEVVVSEFLGHDAGKEFVVLRCF